MMSTYRGGKRRIQSEYRERQAEEEYNQFMDELHQRVDTRRDSDAIVLLLDKYELYSPCLEIYERVEHREFVAGLAVLGDDPFVGVRVGTPLFLLRFLGRGWDPLRAECDTLVLLYLCSTLAASEAQVPP